MIGTLIMTLTTGCNNIVKCFVTPLPKTILSRIVCIKLGHTLLDVELLVDERLLKVMHVS